MPPSPPGHTTMSITTTSNFLSAPKEHDMAKSKKSPQDASGKKAEEQEEKKAEAAKKAEEEKKAEAKKKAEEDDVEVVQDGKSQAKPVTEVEEGDDDEVVEVGEDMVRVKSLDDFKSHVAGRDFEFEAGKKYHIPRDVAQFLNERDYLEILE